MTLPTSWAAPIVNDSVNQQQIHKVVEDEVRKAFSVRNA